jgi:hypothetical protein
MSLIGSLLAVLVVSLLIIGTIVTGRFKSLGGELKSLKKDLDTLHFQCWEGKSDEIRHRRRIERDEIRHRRRIERDARVPKEFSDERLKKLRTEFGSALERLDGLETGGALKELACAFGVMEKAVSRVSSRAAKLYTRVVAKETQDRIAMEKAK